MQVAVKKINVGRKQKRRVKAVMAESLIPPVATGAIYRRIPPQIKSVANQTFVEQCEVVNNFGTNALGVFNSTRIPLSNVQPNWLTGISTSWAKYRYVRARAIYIPSGATINPGTFVMGLGYDFADNAPIDLNSAQTMNKAVSCPLWGGYGGSSLLNSSINALPLANSVIIDIDVNRFALDWYPTVSTQAVFAAYTAQQKNQYAGGYIDASSAGGPAAATSVGQIFLHYIVELIEPTLSSRNI